MLTWAQKDFSKKKCEKGFWSLLGPLPWELFTVLSHSLNQATVITFNKTDALFTTVKKKIFSMQLNLLILLCLCKNHNRMFQSQLELERISFLKKKSFLIESNIISFLFLIVIQSFHSTLACDIVKVHKIQLHFYF